MSQLTRVEHLLGTRYHLRSLHAFTHETLIKTLSGEDYYWFHKWENSGIERISHPCKVMQLVSSRAVIWTHVCLAAKSGTPNMMLGRKYIHLCGVIEDHHRPQPGCSASPWFCVYVCVSVFVCVCVSVSLCVCVFKFVDKSLTEWRSLNWICLLANIAHHITCRASVPYMNQLEPSHLV